MAKHLNYRELIEHLQGFGYTVKTIPWNGSTQWVFEHPENKDAIIFIPERPLEEKVHPMHLGTVRGTLKAHGFISSTTSETI
jgi:hypothetical protein